ncbi:hypothetical protein HWV00_07205 [Moritella sp. 24]|uniref:hypothetical protein n=1 Tax=Moritella sp. 24 TaxID=2746230 RepID=UPI001BA91BE6|nr:hypothetical protein [Moritella sp. 24]QUM76027.1 hypothetical protein HWV00_07205 [Moritella sp. 24]
MQTWKVLMENGNRCFNEKSWLDAELCYQNAIEQITVSWESDPENEELLMGWISGQHNLAALYEEQGQHYTALRYLTMPHQWMMSLLRGESVSNSFKALATQAVKTTLIPLLDFSHRHPICESCFDALQISPDWLKDPHPTIH